MNVLIPPGEVDNGFDPTKTVIALQVSFPFRSTTYHILTYEEIHWTKNKTSVISFLISIVGGFLAKHGFMHSALDVQKYTSATQTIETPRKRRKVFTDQDADDATNGSSLTQIPDVQSLSLRPSSLRSVDDSVSPLTI